MPALNAAPSRFPIQVRTPSSFVSFPVRGLARKSQLCDMDIPTGSIGLVGRLFGKLFGRWLERPKLAIEISFNSSGNIPEPQYGQIKGVMKDGREGWDMQQRLFNKYDVSITNVSHHPVTGVEWISPIMNDEFNLEETISKTKVIKMGESISITIEFTERKRFVGGDVHEYTKQRKEPLSRILFMYRNLHGQAFYTVYDHSNKENIHLQKAAHSQLDIRAILLSYHPFVNASTLSTSFNTVAQVSKFTFSMRS